MLGRIINTTTQCAHVDRLQEFPGAETEEHKLLCLADQKTVSVHNTNEARAGNLRGTACDEHEFLVVAVISLHVQGLVRLDQAILYSQSLGLRDNRNQLLVCEQVVNPTGVTDMNETPYHTELAIEHLL